MISRSIVIFTLLFTFSAFLFANSQKSEALVNEAWQSWETNDQQTVEAKFKEALAVDSTNTRAHLGLMFLYSMQFKDDAAWKSFRQFISNAEDPYPYIFAGWSLIRWTNDHNTKKQDVIDFWQSLTEKSDKGGLLRAMAHQFLGMYYERRNDIPTSRKHFASINALTDWSVIGPFDNVSASGFSKIFPPEKEYKPGKVYEGKNGIPAQWFDIPAVRPDRWIDFMRYFAQGQSVFYGNNFVYSPKKQTVQIRVGTSGSLKTFLNDELILEHFDENNNDLDTYIAETKLQKGWNRLMVKVGYSEITRNNFMVRITGENGNAIEGLQISTEKQSYRSKPKERVKQIPNFAETYFQKKIEQYPDHLENYLLLADSYLRNDKAIEGELAIKQALAKSPNCAMLHEQLVEAYARGEKFDEIATTMERIYNLDPNVPYVLDYKFERYLENEQIEKAEEILARVETLRPESENVYNKRLALYSNKKQIEKIIEISKEGYQIFPDNFQFAYMEATIAVQTTRSYYDAINIYKDQLERRYTMNNLATLADTYLKASDIDSWESTYEQILALDPSAVGYFNQMASTYISLQQYDKAAERIKQTIEICPNSSEYWSRLGQIHQSTKQNDLAITAYKEALKFNPTDYDARRIIRELEGKTSVFAHFETVDIDSLIKHSPTEVDFPDNSALILLDDLKRVVYDRGASEMSEELLVKILNSRGIDEFTEYWIGYNSHTEGLTVEKAVVIKKDGSEITADINGNHIVFKNLEPGEYIYLKWQLKNYYSGKLSNQFWDQFYFNGFYPMIDMRYSLLVPKDVKFHHRAQNMSGDPTKTTTKDGILYQWRRQNEPGIIYEYGMPILDDVGKILYISSIDDWEFMVDWYTDIAQTKARSSYEIKNQVQQLFKDSPNATEQKKIETIYNFITENIRYSSVSFRQSGLVPQEARDVLVNRIGDCKDMSALCIAMLEEVGIDAHFVLVNTKDEGKNFNALPSISFNHCIAGVETADGVQYLDLTASNYPYGSLPDLDVEGFSLEIKPGITEPFYLAQSSSRNILRKMKVIIDEDNSVTLEKQGTRSGSLAAKLRYQYRDKTPATREKMLAESLAGDFPNIRLINFEVENLDEISKPIDYAYDYHVPEYVSEVGKFKFLKIPWTDRLETNRALSYEKREYPYYYWPDADTLREEVEITMPVGYEPVELGENVHLSCSFADYSLEYEMEGNIIRGRRQLVYKKSVVEPEEYPEFRTFYNTIVKQDARQILLKTVDQNQ